MSKRREKRRIAEGGMPPGAVPADPSRKWPEFYVDIHFTCRDCGSEEVWTGKQQKTFYEIKKGSRYAKAVRCHDCLVVYNERRQVQAEQMRAADAARQPDQK